MVRGHWNISEVFFNKNDGPTALDFSTIAWLSKVADKESVVFCKHRRRR